MGVLVGSMAPPVAAQDRHTVEGTVTDGTNGGSLPGVNIQVVGTQIGTTTDQDGRYQLRAPSDTATLRFSFVGYQPRTVDIEGRSTIDIALRVSEVRAEEVVVTGYQTQERASITGAVSSVEPADIQASPQNNAWRALRWERRLELAMESHRFFDLVRWGIAKETLSEYFQVESQRRTHLRGAEFTEGRDEYLPIPQQQIDFSEGLYKQNPGWPGGN